MKECVGHGASVIRRDDPAERTVALELSMSHQSVRVRLVAESRTEVLEIVQRIDEDPGPKALELTDEYAGRGHATPDDGAAVERRPDGHDARRRIPSPHPLVLDGVHVVTGDSEELKHTLSARHVTIVVARREFNGRRSLTPPRRSPIVA
jgi:hypothetical protein